MKLEKIGDNMTVLETDNKEARVLFSYETPVCVWRLGQGYLKTNQKWSKTTSGHVSKWLSGQEAQEVPQAMLDNALAFNLIMRRAGE